jgi:hypothetical protein
LALVGEYRAVAISIIELYDAERERAAGLQEVRSLKALS